MHSRAKLVWITSVSTDGRLGLAACEHLQLLPEYFARSMYSGHLQQQLPLESNDISEVVLHNMSRAIFIAIFFLIS